MTRLLILLAASLYVADAQTVNYTVTTIAGIGRPTGDNGPASGSLLTAPNGVALDPAGNLYVAEAGGHRIRKVDSSGRITTIAGTGARGNSGDGGPAILARLYTPTGIATDLAGNVYFTDIEYDVVRKIAADGTISTIAGTGITGFSGDGGPATAARLNAPTAVAFFGGFVYIADTNNNRIRRISPTGVIATIIGTGSNAGSRLGGPGASIPVSFPDGLAFDSAGNLYIAEYGVVRVLKADSSFNVVPIAGVGQVGESGDGGPALEATLNGPGGLAVDASGTVYVADQIGNRIRRISNGIITAVAGTGTTGFAGDGGTAGAAQFSRPFGLALDATGKLYVADTNNNRIRRIDLITTVVTTFAGGPGLLGDDGPALNALLFAPAGVAFDSAGNFYIADGLNHRIRKITKAGIISTVAGNGIAGFSGDGGDARAAQVNNPQGIFVDSAGNLLIADSGNNRIRRVNQSGTIQTLAGNGTAQFAGDGGAATLASLYRPNAVIADPQGSLYIADSGNNRIRKVTVVGQISTYAGSNATTLGDNGPAVSASLSLPLGIALDSAGNLYIADTVNNRIRKVSFTGTITTIAGNDSTGFAGDGGPAVMATLHLPFGVALDAAGNIYISDGLNGRARQIDIANVIRTIGGNGGLGYDGDGGPALLAQLGFIGGIAVDAAGAVYTSDQDNHRVRKLTPVLAVPDFSLAIASSDAGIQLTLVSLNSFAGTVQLAVKNPEIRLPALSPVILAAGKTTVVTVPAFTVPANTLQVIFTADSGALHHEATLAVTPSGPVLSANGIANAASFLGGAVAPGEIVTIYGTGLGGTLTTLVLDDAGRVATKLAGTSLTFNSKPAPLLYVSEGQLSAIVPYGLTGTAQLQVTYNGSVSNAVTVAITDAAPALFTVNASGSGQAAVLNQDGSVNSAANPAAKGSVVVLYGTGEGSTDPGGVDGQLAASVYPKPVLPVSVSVDGQPAQVLYAGAAPGQVAGLLQVNVSVPDGAQSGSVPVVITVGAKSSPLTGVSISVR